MEAFYVYLWILLSRLIGTEEQVLLRRRCFELFGKLRDFNSEQIKIIFTGSRAEGLALEGSDFDVMYVYCDLPVCMSTFWQDHGTNMVMETDHIKPGSVRIRCKDTTKTIEELIPSLVQTNDALFLSSSFFRDNIVHRINKKLPGAVPHGPCASSAGAIFGYVFECDIMYCLPSSSWPASEWKHRTRNNGWPSRALIEDIIQEGCFLVPIGNRHSNYSFMEWRISFSLAEKRLVHSFNHTQLLCYGLLKLFLKHVINSNIEVKDLLCSYFLKTSLFYCIEEENISWCRENIFDCFWICFTRLLKWVQQGYCPNYFIKENNMIEGKICGSNQRILLRYLSKLHAEGHDSLQRIPGIVLGVQKGISREIQLREKELLFDIEFSKNIYGCIAVIKNENIRRLRMLLNMIQEATMDIDKRILQAWYGNCRILQIQQLHKGILESGSDKTHYKNLEGIKRCIKTNSMNLDECTRMLMLATLCYLNGEYKDVVSIVNESLKIYSRFMTMICNRQLYMDEICGQGYTLQQKMDLGVFPYFMFFILECGFYPKEIEPELILCEVYGCTFVPAIIYSNVLLVLSYHHMKLTQNMNFALKELSLAAFGHLCSVYDHIKSIILLHKCIEITKSHQENI